jgi:glycosyltransferase
MEKLLVSIITVTYNSRTTIADTIRSVASQSYSNIEHVIIDGSSTDNTLEIVRNSPNRITKIISEPDKGIYDALNKGIINSSGHIIGLLHSDDELASETIIEEVSQKFKLQLILFMEI